MSFWMHLNCLFRFWGGFLPCDFISLIGPEEVIEFQVCPGFSFYKAKSNIFRALYMS